MQQFKDLNTNFSRAWNFARSETLELLEALSDEDLKFKPQGADTWQPLFYQFNCLGRTQMVYSNAIKMGKMDFDFFENKLLPDKDEFKTKGEIKLFLEKANKEWSAVCNSVRKDPEFKVSWPGFKQPLMNHISSLIAHERLHHGQLISYFTLAGIPLPPKFKQNWAL